MEIVQHKKAAAAIPPPSRLLDIPSEIRLMIYEHLRPSRIGPGDHIGLLQSCRLLRHEYISEAMKDIEADFDFYCSQMAEKEVKIMSSLDEVLTTSTLKLRIWKPECRAELWLKYFKEILNINFQWITRVRITVEKEPRRYRHVWPTIPDSFWLLQAMLDDLSEPLYEWRMCSQLGRQSHIKKLFVTWRDMPEDPWNSVSTEVLWPQGYSPRYYWTDLEPEVGPRATAIQDDNGKCVGMEWTC